MFLLKSAAIHCKPASAVGSISLSLLEQGCLRAGGPGDSIKICDFGLSGVARVGGGGGTGAPIGTAQWMAPEILQNGVYSAAADVYSFGVVLGEMLSGEVPWL